MHKRMNSKIPLISVITICFNAEAYIKQCLDSVIHQDFNDYEYIVIDGGSTDGTADIIKKYQEHLAYWHSKVDRGLSHAFNQGLEHATGRWVIFLNSDDYFCNPTVLEKFSTILLANRDKDVLFGQIQMVSREQTPECLAAPVGHPFDWGEFIKRDTIPHPSAFTNMSFVRRVGPFDESYRIAIDYEFYLRGGEKLKAVFYPELVSCMREGGVSRVHRRACLNECLGALKQHKSCSSLFIFVYGNYLRFRIFVRDMLVKFRIISE